MTDRRAPRARRTPGGLIAVMLLFASTGASAAEDDAKAQARKHYDQGVIEYNLGRFQTAVSELTKAYELDPEPILLFNIAQAHRRLGNREQAIFFYQRYLASDPPPAKADEVHRRIADLKAKQREEQAAVAAPPVVEQPMPAPVRPPPAPVGDTAAAAPPAARQSHAAASSRGLELALSAGVAQPLFPAAEFSRPALPAGELNVAYFTRGQGVSFGAGLAVPYLRIPYEGPGGAAQASHVIGPLATGALGWRLAPAIELRGHLAAGVLWWTGLGTENPFTAPDVAALGLPAVRLAVELRWQASARLFLGLGPSYLTTAASDDLTGSLARLTAWGLLARVGAEL